MPEKAAAERVISPEPNPLRDHFVIFLSQTLFAERHEIELRHHLGLCAFSLPKQKISEAFLWMEPPNPKVGSKALPNQNGKSRRLIFSRLEHLKQTIGNHSYTGCNGRVRPDK